jgi:hypothetical protein
MKPTARFCTISDNESCYALLHGGKEGGLIQAPLDSEGDPDWSRERHVDFLRIGNREAQYLRVVTGMLIALEWLQGER